MASILPAVVVDFGTWLFSSSAAAVVTRTVVAVVVSRLIAQRLAPGASGGAGPGRIQFAPATDNKIPVTYGSAFISGPITDAKISTDLKTMWFVIALSEVTDTTPGSYNSFGDIYYDGKLVTFGTDSLGNYTKVASLTTNSNPAQVDTTQAGTIFFYLYPNGSVDLTHSNTTQTAVQILQDSGIPSGQQWTSNDTMTLCSFAIVKIIYNTTAGTTGLGACTFQLKNSITDPGAAILDYMVNPRYGAGLPLNTIDTDSIATLTAYSAQQITYKNASGEGTGPTGTQNRYYVNGPLDTGQSCSVNIGLLLDTCDSWLQYSEITGKWSIIINRSYLHDGIIVTSVTIGNNYSIQSLGTMTQDQWNALAGTSGVTYAIGSIFTAAIVPTGQDGIVVSAPFLVDDSNLVGGINLAPVSLNDTYNVVEVAHPDHNVKDQTDYEIYDLVTSGTEWYNPNFINPNEPYNRLNLNLQLVNNVVQAGYVGVRRLVNSRINLTATFKMDYSGIQVLAGDVIRINFAPYGWTNKLFRVQTTAEERDGNGNLFTNLTVFEYEEFAYTDWEIQDIVYYFNNGLQNPGVSNPPTTPTPNTQINTQLVNSNVANSSQQTISNNSSTTTSVSLTTTLPNSSAITAVTFNIGNTANAEQHFVATQIFPTSGDYFEAGSNVTANIQNLPAGNYYFSATAYNPIAGRTSNSTANAFTWNGAGLTTPNTSSNTGNITGNTVNYNGNLGANYNFYQGANITIINSNGVQVPGSYYITSLASGNLFNIYPTPPYSIANGNIIISTGGISGNQYIQPASITPAQLGPTIYSLTPVANLSFTARYTTPVDITSPNYNVPVYLTGTDVSSTKYWPFYQGTSSTADGYVANSTGPFAPSNADLLNIMNGDDNWWILSKIQVNSAGSFNTLNFDTTIQMVSDTNTMVQFWHYRLNSAYNIIGTGDIYLTTVSLIANEPQTLTIKGSTSGTASDYAGFIMRNMVSGTTVYITGLLETYYGVNNG